MCCIESIGYKLITTIGEYVESFGISTRRKITEKLIGKPFAIIIAYCVDTQAASGYVPITVAHADEQKHTVISLAVAIAVIVVIIIGKSTRSFSVKIVYGYNRNSTFKSFRNLAELWSGSGSFAGGTSS